MIAAVISILMLFPQIQQFIIILTEKYIIHRPLQNHVRWENRIFSFALMCILIILVFCFCFFSKIRNKLVKSSKMELKTWVSEIDYEYLLKPVLIMTGIYLLAMLSIIRADFQYIDDMGHGRATPARHER
jgi:Na+/melibiose symporter-like transporter